MTDTLDHRGLAELLKILAYAEPASHFHGVLCGALCVIAADELDVAALLEDGSEQPDALEPHVREALWTLRDETNSDLLSTEMGFEPLLPADSLPLRERVESLAAWCSGFLYGLSSRRNLDLRVLSEEARETLRDFSQFTQAGFDADGDPESEETSYTELVEYIRVGAQLLFLEMRPRPPSLDDESSTLH
ncbi:MAG: UPF0149 family protein [Panacagrimonas sp.]